MNNKNKKKTEPWQIVVFILAAAFIICMWIKNDIIEIYTTMPKEQILPMILTTAIVALFKVFVIAGVVLLIKLIIEKVKNKTEK